VASRTESEFKESHLYAFINNSPLDTVDYLGLLPCDAAEDATCGSECISRYPGAIIRSHTCNKWFTIWIPVFADFLCLIVNVCATVVLRFARMTQRIQTCLSVTSVVLDLAGSVSGFSELLLARRRRCSVINFSERLGVVVHNENFDENSIDAWDCSYVTQYSVLGTMLRICLYEKKSVYAWSLGLVYHEWTKNDLIDKYRCDAVFHRLCTCDWSISAANSNQP
jgi:hypothetical protein